MLRSRLGQMSLMFIIAIAIALVFLAMTMNWNRIAQLKSQCQVATTTAAATLVSRMASYGENVLMVQLGGKKEICNWTGVMAAFLMVILIVVIIIVSIYCAPCGAAISATSLGWWGLGIALALSVATLVIQIAVIQPAITKMWNKLQQNIKTVEDKVLESGLQAGLQSAVTDTEQIRDVLDYNMNGRWNIPGNAGSTDSDMISRLVYHYTQRLASMQPPDTAEYVALKNGLAQLMQDLGAVESVTCCVGAPPPGLNFCNVACVPTEGAVVPELDDLAVVAGCQLNPFLGYPFSYDSLYCERLTAPTTLVGLLGRDDSSIALAKGVPFAIDSAEAPGGPGIFQEADSDGRLFPLLWALKNLSEQKFNLSGDATRVILPDDVTFSVQSLINNDIPGSCPGTDGNGVWRPGNDLFCSQNLVGTDYVAPHYSNCPKFSLACTDPNNSTAGCLCTDPGAVPLIWYDDKIDEYWVGLREIAGKVKVIVGDSTNSLMPQLATMEADINASVTFLQTMQVDFNSWNTTLMSWYVDAVHTRSMYPLVPNLQGLPEGVFCEAAARDSSSIAPEIGTATIGTLQAVINCEQFYADPVLGAMKKFDVCLAECSNPQATCDAKTANCTASTAACAACPAANAACVAACLPTDTACLNACDCTLMCSAATTTCADATAFCADLVVVASCVTRPRTLAPPDPIDGVLLDDRPVDCTAGSKFLAVLPDSVTRAHGAAPLFALRVATLLTAQTRAQALLDFLSVAIANGFATLGNILPLFYDALNAQTANQQVSPYIIYGWESIDKKDPKGTLGRIHIVKVEAWVPKRCDGWNCCATQFPWVKTKKKGAFKRCYFIADESGRIKARVSRFDEDPGGGVLRFVGNSLAFWQTQGRHPLSTTVSQDVYLQDIRNDCFGVDKIALPGMTPNAYDIPGSFMINGDDDANYGGKTGRCHIAAKALIRQGFVTEVCARYYLEDHYKMRFINCKDSC